MTLNSKAYLTIDDSPSDRMDDLVDYLEGRGIPAMFFCRGDNLERHMDSAIRALKKGFILANHSFTHQRSSEKDLDWIITDIERCEKLLGECHAEAGISSYQKYFRFPHVDRGTAGWIVDYDAYEGQEREAVLAAFAAGLNVQSMDRPEAVAFEKKEKLQKYLGDAGYIQPFKDVTQSWFANGEIATANDCLYTFSNCDWMVTDRHIGKWPYKSVADLKAKALNDPWLSQDNSVNVILAHDQAEIVDVTIELIEDLASNGLQFLEV